jgi:hypothetical protein
MRGDIVCWTQRPDPPPSCRRRARLRPRHRGAWHRWGEPNGHKHEGLPLKRVLMHALPELRVSSATWSIRARDAANTICCSANLERTLRTIRVQAMSRDFEYDGSAIVGYGFRTRGGPSTQ